MPARYAVDTHPDRDKIVKAIIKGESSLRDIGGLYGISKSAIQRYLTRQLQAQAVAVAEKRGAEQGSALLERVEETMTRMQKLYAACDEYLTDPDNPDKYTLMPRAWEWEVIWLDHDANGRTRERKDKLQTLLNRLREGGYVPLQTEFKVSDPRKLIIDTARILTSQLETLARIQGAIKDVITASITVNQSWVEWRTLIIKTLDKYPDALDALMDALEKAEHGDKQ
jgi:hypothetical protein